MPEERYELNLNWTLSFTHPTENVRYAIPATVPGNVEIDLQREGLVGEIHPSATPDAMRAWDMVDDWVYRSEFDAPENGAGREIDLVFDGVDTIAEVFLNGEKLLDCANMFISHTVAVADRLQSTGNVLEIRIFSPELYARRFDYDDCAATLYHHEGYSYLRKARHMWGWDNAPRLLSAGLWRPVFLVIKEPVRFEEVYIYTVKTSEYVAQLGVNWKIVTPDIDLRDYHGEIVFSLDGKIVCKQDFIITQTFGRINRDLSITSPQLWWPRGYGNATLYDVKLELYKGGQPTATWNSKFGIREIELIHTKITNDDGLGEFVFKCNGEKIYCRGTNWKPLDALHSRAAEKTVRALELCLDCNCNMVRIWGGGIYEDHEFFDYCDKYGLLVWQDFMLACEFPPQNDFYLKAIAEEAEVIIKRLRNHPSLALWCGDNETDMAFFWGNLYLPHLLPSHNAVSRRVLKEAVLRFDPCRSYLESSPFIDDETVKERLVDGAGEECMLLQAPEQHIYVENEDFRSVFKRSNAHFVSETGPMRYCAISESTDIAEGELQRARKLWDMPVTSASALDTRHQSDDYFIHWKHSLQKNLTRFFDREFSIDHLSELTLATNIMAGDVYKFAVEYFRIHKWRRTGVLWWSLLDMWPMMFNFSVVDSNFRKKKPYYWIKQSQQPLCLIAEDAEDGDCDLYAVNDTLREIHGQYRLCRITAEGKEEIFLQDVFRSGKNVSVMIAKGIHLPERQCLYLIEWDVDGHTYYNHFVAGKPPFPFDAYKRWSAYLDQRYACDTKIKQP